MMTKHLCRIFSIFGVISLLLCIPLVSASDTHSINSQIDNGNPDIYLDAVELSIPNVQSSNVVVDGIITSNEYVGGYDDPDTGISINWEHNGTYLKVGLISPATGWVSFAVGDKMLDANFILGGFDSGSTYIRDLIGLANHLHGNDTDNGGSFDILEFNAQENTTSTSLEFIIPLNSSDSLDPALEIGNLYDIFVAYSASDDPTSYHSGYSTIFSVYIDLDANSENNQLGVDIGNFDVSIPYVENSSVIIDGSIDEGEYTEKFVEKKTGIEVNWEHNGENLTVGLRSPGNGWVALGIGERMQGANMILGGVDGGSVYCEDLNGLPDWVHQEDDVSNILACDASEDQGGTTLEFILPFNSSDEVDPELEVGKVYGMFFGLQLTIDETTQIHDSHSSVIDVLIRPEATQINTEMQIHGSEIVDYNATLYMEVTLKSGGAPVEGVPVEFFLVTNFGELSIETVLTDINGKANITYWNPHIIDEHTFGARSEEMIYFEAGEVKVLKSSVSLVDVFFEELEEEVEPFLAQSKVAILVAFWLAGIFIWGSFAYVIWLMYLIFKDRNSALPDEVNN